MLYLRHALATATSDTPNRSATFMTGSAQTNRIYLTERYFGAEKRNL
jgi:hypothetical protein